MRSTTAVSAAAALLLAAAGCSSSHPAPAAAPSNSRSASTAPSSPAASASPSPSAAAGGFPLGTVHSAKGSDGVTVKMTASSYKVVTLAGEKIALVQAEGCLVAYSGPVSFTWSPWTLVTTGGATVTPLSHFVTNDFPGSLYPNDPQSATPVGRCRSGLIPFSLNDVTGMPAMVEYNSASVVMDWRVS